MRLISKLMSVIFPLLLQTVRFWLFCFFNDEMTTYFLTTEEVGDHAHERQEPPGGYTREHKNLSWTAQLWEHHSDTGVCHAQMWVSLFAAFLF